MKALILAAGRGERMRPLTDTTPKPLLLADGKPLIVWHLEKLAALGIRDVVINTSHLAAQFPAVLGDGARWGLRLRFAHEGPEPLETGGGMLNALPWLTGEAFIAINGDVWTDYDLARLPAAPSGLAHLVLVANPPQHPSGDFVLDRSGRVALAGAPRLTFAGIGVYRPALLDDWADAVAGRGEPPRFPLAPLLRRAIAGNAVSGERHDGGWSDVGTPDRLAALGHQLRRRSAPESR
jgi:N-acetyl-alpha-D-muramate 1-phosphate uridylyltransferase